MPLLKNYTTNSSVKLFIRRMNESPEELMYLAGLDGKFEDWMPQITHPKRKKELLGLKVLLREVDFALPITYLPNGKPWVDEKNFISISHCNDIAGFMWAGSSCGLDIQDPNPKLGRIASRFCHPDELQMADRANNRLEFLTAVWSIKEAVFKVFGEHVVFAEEIRVEEFDPLRSKVVNVLCHREGKEIPFEVDLDILDGYFIVRTHLS